MSVEITMPPLSETMEEGKIVKWFKHEGDRVQKDEPLYEVESDKATVQINTVCSGTIEKIIVGEGECAVVGKIIAYICDE